VLLAVPLIGSASEAQLPDLSHAVWLPAFEDGWEVADSTVAYEVGSLAPTSDRDVFRFLGRAPAPKPKFPCALLACSAEQEKQYWREMASPEARARFYIGYEYVNCHSYFMRGGRSWLVDSIGRVISSKPASAKWAHLPSLARPVCRKILDPP
jgi:hypothetical protein